MASNPLDENNDFDFDTGTIGGLSVIVDPAAATDPGPWPGDGFDIGMVSGTDPFLFTVSSSVGTVAQQAYTWTESNNFGETIIDERHHIDQLTNVCIDGGYTLYSENGGDLYCVVYTGQGSRLGRPDGHDRPCPSHSRCRWQTRSTPARRAVHDMSEQQQQLKLSHCAPLTLTRSRCSVSWHDTTYRYVGTVTVWDHSPASKYLDLGWNIRRTKLDCTRTCTRHIVVPA